MAPRFYCPAALTTGELLNLPVSATRHVQVLRLQPGDPITLFNGGPGWDDHDADHQPRGEFNATITQIGRSQVQVKLGAQNPVERQAARQVHLAVGMPANERMDWLVEKATELGVASLQPLMTERSVLRLVGERAQKKQAHWQSVAVAACEQCGGNRVPLVHPVISFTAWIRARPNAPDQPLAVVGQAVMLSLRPGTPGFTETMNRLDQGAARDTAITLLSGPEGGLSPAEEDTAMTCGFAPSTLSRRVLRAETAALCGLAALVVL